ncbi:unnamed protein product [Orchesella dallaii]|uniref:Heat shock factor-binding protein 1 n=1 Tax=Orchesella dallaii TaxID=48710 RepID=A0ABP1RAR0_9HEXA
MLDTSNTSTSTDDESKPEITLTDISKQLDELTVSSSTINEMAKSINEEMIQFHHRLSSFLRRMNNLESQMEYVLERLDPPEGSQDSGSESLNPTPEPSP